MGNKIIKKFSKLANDYKDKEPDEKFFQQLSLLTSKIRGQKKQDDTYGQAKHSKDLVGETLEKFQMMQKNNYQSYLKTGFKEYDKITKGLAKGELVVIGSRPGVGKTALMVQLASNIARKNETVLFFSFDLTQDKIITRLLACKSGISTYKIEELKLNNKDKAKLMDASGHIASLPLFLIDTPETNVPDFIGQCRQVFEKIKPDIVFIDYLQLINDIHKNKNRKRELTFLMCELKSLARSFDIAIVMGSQLNRSMESRGGSKRPQLNDLFEGEIIEQYADKVILLYRPGYYGFDFDENGSSSAGLIELIIAKNNNGAVGTGRIKHDILFTQLSDFDSLNNNITISDDELRDML